MQNLPQCLGIPCELLLIAKAMLGLEIANQRAQVVRDGLKLFRRASRKTLRHLAAHDRTKPRDPSPQAELCDHHRDDRHHERESDEEIEQIALSFLAAPRHEAHVVKQDQLRLSPDCGNGDDRDEQRAGTSGDDAAAGFGESARLRAVDRGRHA